MGKSENTAGNITEQKTSIPTGKSTAVKDGLILVVITLVAAVMLSFVYELTAEARAAQVAKAKIEAYEAVCPNLSAYEEIEELTGMAVAFTDYEKITIDEAILAKDAEGNALGLLLTVTTMNGYDGQITFSMGYSLDGEVTGIAFLTITETAGLGLRADEDEFKNQFKKSTDSFALYKGNTVEIKGSERVDSISSATVTSRAVTNAVNAGIDFASDALVKVELRGGDK